MARLSLDASNQASRGACRKFRKYEVEWLNVSNPDGKKATGGRKLLAHNAETIGLYFLLSAWSAVAAGQRHNVVLSSKDVGVQH